MSGHFEEFTLLGVLFLCLFAWKFHKNIVTLPAEI